MKKGEQATRTPTGFALQPRDMDLMSGMFDSRIMTLEHISRLYFDGKREAAKKRVQRLKAAGWIAERPRRSTEPATHILTGRGISLLAESGRLNGYPRLSDASLRKRAQVSDLTLLHELAVVDMRVAITIAVAKSPTLTVAEFSTWPMLSQFSVPRHLVDRGERGSVVVKPDGFLRIHETASDGGVDEHVCFMELDRSSESQEILARKALCYGHFYRSGGLAVRHGRQESDFAEFPFRVLMVMQSPERCRNTALRLLENDPPTLSQVWLASQSDVCADPLGPIWSRPMDFRNASDSERIARHPLL